MSSVIKVEVESLAIHQLLVVIHDCVWLLHSRPRSLTSSERNWEEIDLELGNSFVAAVEVSLYRHREAAVHSPGIQIDYYIHDHKKICYSTDDRVHDDSGRTHSCCCCPALLSEKDNEIQQGPGVVSKMRID